jgi:hypothetical protein
VPVIAQVPASPLAAVAAEAVPESALQTSVRAAAPSPLVLAKAEAAPELAAAW